MGQKVDPRGLRLGITRAWDSNWYADKKEYVKYFHEDVQIKEFIKKNYFHTGISKVRIERTSPSQVVVHIHTGKAGLIIGRKGAEIDALRAKLEKLTAKKVTVKVQEIKDLNGDAVLVADMSSNILSRQIDISKFGVIYAGAQKNLGPAGITLVIIRDDLIGHARKDTPSIWNYAVQRDADSMINTPPTFAWYLCSLVFKHIQSIGGLDIIAKRNTLKAQTLYNYIDSSKLYRNVVAKENRSTMNVTFITGNAELDAKFVAESTAAGLQALKGHKVLGGMRASIYNAMPLEGVEALIKFMKKFEAENS